MDPLNKINYKDITRKIFFVIVVLLITIFIAKSSTAIPTNRLGSKIDDNDSQTQSIPLTLEAKYVYVYDINTGEVIYDKNSDIPTPLASLTKLMTALVAIETLPEFTLVEIDKDSISTMGDDKLFVGEKFKLSDLISFTLSVSSNDGAHAIAKIINSSLTSANNLNADSLKPFLDIMNKRAKDLGMSHTYFINETGLDVNTSLAGAYGSAKDIALLMGYIFKNHPDMVEKTKYSSLSITSASGQTHIIKNTNKSLDEIPNLLASKTGFTDLAGGNLVYVFDAGLNRPVVVALLGSEFNTRFDDAVKISTWIISSNL